MASGILNRKIPALDRAILDEYYKNDLESRIAALEANTTIAEVYYGITDSLTLLHAPIETEMFALFINGVAQESGVAYTRAGQNITFTESLNSNARYPDRVLVLYVYVNS